MAELKSMAHKDWPYAGTAHEWRGFAEYASDRVFDGKRPLSNEQVERLKAVYQKQNFGPELK